MNDNDNFNINDNFDNFNDIYDWDQPATPVALPVQPVIDTNGWHWYPDANGQLFTLYFDGDGNECMMWQIDDNGTFYWRCAGVGYTCREIGIENRRGIFYQNLLVGTMLLDNDLTVTWLPETYIPDNIPDIQQINYINTITINYDISDETDETDEDDFDP